MWTADRILMWCVFILFLGKPKVAEICNPVYKVRSNMQEKGQGILQSENTKELETPPLSCD